jgi:hypothetical protein
LQEELRVVSTIASRKVYVCVAIRFFTFLTFTLLASVLHRRHGFPLGESYIHQPVARNFATSGKLGFISQKMSSDSNKSARELIETGHAMKL